MERESNDNPDIPDMRGTSEIPGFPSRHCGRGRQSVYFLRWNWKTRNHPVTVIQHMQCRSCLSLHLHHSCTADRAAVTYWWHGPLPHPTLSWPDHSKLTIGHSKLTTDHSKLTTGQSKLTTGHSKLTTSHSKLTTSYFKLTIGHSKLTTGHFKLTMGHSKLTTSHSNLTTNHSKLTTGCSNWPQAPLSWGFMKHVFTHFQCNNFYVQVDHVQKVLIMMGQHSDWSGPVIVSSKFKKKKKKNGTSFSHFRIWILLGNTSKWYGQCEWKFNPCTGHTQLTKEWLLTFVGPLAQFNLHHIFRGWL